LSVPLLFYSFEAFGSLKVITMKGKEYGRRFESKIRKFLSNNGFYVYVKGVSTKGPDILAIKRDTCLLLELKSYKHINNSTLKRFITLIDKLKREKEKIVSRTFCQVIIGVLIQDREKREFIFIDENEELKTFQRLGDLIEILKVVKEN